MRRLSLTLLCGLILAPAALAASRATGDGVLELRAVAGTVSLSGKGALWAANSPEATHAVDTTDTFAAGVASLEAHRAYLDGLNWPDFDAEEFLEGFGRAAGSRLGTRLAAAFEVFAF